MISNLFRFRIPTLIGLAVLSVSLIFGIYLVLQKQILSIKASGDTAAKNITFANITDGSISISWQTAIKTPGFITYGPSSPNEQTVLDDRDGQKPQAYFAHHISLKNLSPQTNYQLKVYSGNWVSEILSFTTASTIDIQTNFKPVIGVVVDDQRYLEDSLIYLNIPKANIQSSVIKNLGNFIIPLNLLRKEDLSNVFIMQEGSEGKLTIISEKGQMSVVFKLKDFDNQLGTIKFGQNINLTDQKAVILIQEDVTKFDLNNDKLINSSDYAIILKNFGNNPKDRKADLNTDGVVDQKDLSEMSKKLNEQKR